MGWLSKLFGDCGKVRFEGETVDGREFGGTTEIESFNNSKEEIEEKLKDIFYVEKGVRVKTLRITAFVYR
jgi:hypothetical protein